jgi:hypothetical protein
LSTIVSGSVRRVTPIQECSPRAAGSVYPLLNGLYRLLVNLTEAAPVVARRVDSFAVTVIVASRSGPRDGGESLDDLLTGDGETARQVHARSVLHHERCANKQGVNTRISPRTAETSPVISAGNSRGRDVFCGARPASAL